MKVAVIPARGGSKRIPRKNIRLFSGKPLIWYSISAALQSGLFDRVIVSTDDQEVARIAEESGAEVPFFRPAELANDHTTTAAVISHAICWMQEHGWSPDHICCIYPTAPLLRIEDLVDGLNALNSGKWEYAFPVAEFSAPVFRSFALAPNGGVKMFFPENYFARSQDLPRAYHDAGQFYWGTAGAWLAEKIFFDEHSYPLVLPAWRVQDIDNEDDWLQAEHKFELLSR